MCFTIFQNEKTPFWAIKTRSSKYRKIGVFPNRLVYVLFKNGPPLHLFLFLAIQARKNFFYDILDRKNAAFWTFFKLYFCRLHCTFFYSENQIKIFSGLICPKSHLKNKISFFDKKRGLILLESFIFSTFLKVFLSCLKTTLFY